MRKRLVLVGIAPDLTFRAIRRAHKMGFEVIIIENEKEIADFSDIIGEADQVSVGDITEYSSLLEIVNQINQIRKIDAMFTFREFSSEPTARIIAELGLYGLPLETVENCNNKYMTKVLLEKSDILTAEYTLCHTKKDAMAFFHDMNAPVILKPLKEQGSLGVYKAETCEELDNYYEQCLIDCNHADILIEKFLVGKEISFEVLVHFGEVHVLGITEKHLFSNTFVEAGHTTPLHSPEMDLKIASDIAKKIVDAMNISFGPMFIEGFITPDGFFVSEIHTRYGGDNITTITELAHNVDMISPIFSELLGEKMTITKNSSRVAGARFLTAKHGEIIDIHGEKQIMQIKGVNSYRLFCNIGDRVHKLTWNRDRLGWIVASADTREELDNIFIKVFHVFSIHTK